MVGYCSSATTGRSVPQPSRAAARGPGRGGSNARRDRRSCPPRRPGRAWNSSSQTSATVRSISLAGATYVACRVARRHRRARRPMPCVEAGSERRELGERRVGLPGEAREDRRQAVEQSSQRRRLRTRSRCPSSFSVELRARRHGERQRIVRRLRRRQRLDVDRPPVAARRRPRGSSGRRPGCRTAAAATGRRPTPGCPTSDAYWCWAISRLRSCSSGEPVGDHAGRRRAARAPAGCSRTARRASRRPGAPAAGRRTPRRRRRRPGRSGGRAGCAQAPWTSVLSVTRWARARLLQGGGRRAVQPRGRLADRRPRQPRTGVAAGEAASAR